MAFTHRTGLSQIFPNAISEEADRALDRRIGPCARQAPRRQGGRNGSNCVVELVRRPMIWLQLPGLPPDSAHQVAGFSADRHSPYA